MALYDCVILIGAMKDTGMENICDLLFAIHMLLPLVLLPLVLLPLVLLHMERDQSPFAGKCNPFHPFPLIIA